MDNQFAEVLAFDAVPVHPHRLSMPEGSLSILAPVEILKMHPCLPWQLAMVRH